MPSRRTFLKSSSVLVAGAAAATASPIPLAAEPAPQQASELPPAIAALSSMRSQMTPISKDERRGRIEKARKLMAEQKLGAILLTGGTSLVYYAGMEWGLSERMLALIIPVKGTPFVVCPAFEHDRAMEQVQQGPLDQGTDIMTWEEHESPWTLVAKGLRSRGLASATIGIEETVRFVFSDGLARELPSAKIVSATPVTAGCRVIKDAHELALMRLASQVTLLAYEAAWKSMKEGMTQDEFGKLVSMAHDRLGFRGGASVQTGPWSALPHGSIQKQVIREGTIILIDGGCDVGGYKSDLSRTFVLGKATDRMKQVFEIEHAAQTAAVKTARPGLACGAVDAAARKIIVDGGFGPDYKYFSHRVGHGMGMDGHEWPYLVKDNPLPLRPGMVFSDEPGIYIPGEFGIRLEDDMVITENGAELFTPQSPSLETPFAPA
jgi:Xaa-Pro dipeptidase